MMNKNRKIDFYVRCANDDTVTRSCDQRLSPGRSNGNNHILESSSSDSVLEPHDGNVLPKMQGTGFACCILGSTAPFPDLRISNEPGYVHLPASTVKSGAKRS